MKRKGLTFPIAYGDKSNLWRGGVNKINKPIKRLIRDSNLYKDWRKKIMERDNYTCQFCNKRGVKLEVDHYPYSFSMILNSIKGINKDNLNNIINDLPFFWDIENGRTLCKQCHQICGNKNHNKYFNIFDYYKSLCLLN